MGPAARIPDHALAPHAGGAVEGEETPGTVARRLLHGEVAVQVHALHAGEKVVFPVDMAPAGLDEAHAFIREEMDGFLQRFRNEVGVQNQQEFALGHLGGRFQRAGLEARAVRAVDADGVKAAGLQFLHLAVALFRGVVCGIVQNLDFQLVLRIIQSGYGFQKAVHDELLIEHGELDRNDGQFLEAGLGLGLVVAVLPVQVNDAQAVKAVSG